MPDEPDHRHIAFILGALHGYRIQQHRHGTVVPCGDSHGERQFRDAADAQFRGLLVKHPLQSAVRRTQHAVVAEQQIQRRAGLPANSWAMPEGWAWVISSFAAS